MATYVPEPRPANAGHAWPELHHLDGVPWFEAPIPRRLHRCRVQTDGWVGLHQVQRCACGAIRAGRRWRERNSRQRPARPVPSTPYMERKLAEVERIDARLGGGE